MSIKELSYEELERQNKVLQSQISSLTEELEALRSSFFNEENTFKEGFFGINENINDVVYRFNLNAGEFNYISPQVKHILGYTQEEISKHKIIIRRIIHPDSISDFFQYWRNIFKGIIPEYIEFKVFKKNGEVRWVMQKNILIQDKVNNVNVVEGIITDVTDRKNAEEALIESEAQKNAIFNNLPHLAWLKDCNGVYLSVNQSFADHAHRSVEELIGLTDYDFCPTELASKYRDADLHVILNKTQLYTEEREGDSFWETFRAPIFNQLGYVMGVTGIALEISERKRSEEEVKEYSEKLAVQNVKLKLMNDELKIANNKAEEANKLKSAFLANMSHEIRTPMNAILGFATLLRDRKLSEVKQIEFINLINSNCRQLLHIISDIIDISKIEANQITVFNKSFNVNKVIQILKHNFDNQIKIAQKPIQLLTFYALENDDAQIFTDKVRLEQILSNLLSNAIKFTEEGTIEIGYRINKSKSHITFYVKDTGIGMTESEVEVIFERFRQVNSSYNKLYGGTGLGLSISKGLAEKLGGEIWVESKIGKGSTFFFEIPFKIGVQTKSDKIPYTSVYDWKGFNILIAEDEQTNFSLLQNIILPTKANIIWAKNGLDVIELCKVNERIDLILMDIKMPEMNGLEATKQIRTFNKEIPIIAQTAFAMPNDEDNCLKAGCTDYLAKPLKVEDILNKIHKYLKRTDSTENSEEQHLASNTKKR